MYQLPRITSQTNAKEDTQLFSKIAVGISYHDIGYCVILID